MKIAIFNKLFKRIKDNSTLYYPRKYYYQSFFEGYKDLSGYYNLGLLLESQNSLQTDKDITLIKGQPFSVHRKEIVNVYKKPRAKFRINEKSLVIDIFIYKIYLGEYRARLELHMNEDSLFYYRYIFSQNLNSQDKQNIVKIIQEKYLQGASIDTTNQNIVDPNQTLLQIENDVNFNIHYGNVSSIVFQKLNVYKTQYKREKIRKVNIKLEDLKQKL